jgi:hypothetical protein
MQTKNEIKEIVIEISNSRKDIKLEHEIIMK